MRAAPTPARSAKKPNSQQARRRSGRRVRNKTESERSVAHGKPNRFAANERRGIKFRNRRVKSFAGRFVRQND